MKDAATLAQRHTEAVIRGIERQRNEALSREAQQAALVQLLQGQLQALQTKMTTEISARDAEIEALKGQIAAAPNPRRSKAA